MTKILVTGASGFIGENLISKLHSSEYEIIKLTSSSGDVADKSTWSNFESADILIHLAGSTFVPDSWNNPASFLKTNFHGTVCALDYCREHNARLVYLSSYLYGNPIKLPISESAPLVANNPYALSKKLAEEVCRFYSDFYGVKVTIFRPFNVYGPGQSEQFLIPSVINQARAGNVIRVKDLQPKRDYIHIEDLVDAIIKAVATPLDFDVFNIGTGVSYSVAELIDIIQHIMGTRLEVQTDGEKRIGEIMDTQADITKASDILEWVPKFSLRTGLEKMLINNG
jgi:GDP-4-dehydro-6-deoxy-D-mannose reductase